ncbi:prephenate dehydrogenase/arogenate dehydrogenase family protein [soil metagenome]
MQRVAIVGLGLIGGSIGLGLKKWSAENAKGTDQALEIIGFDADIDQQQYAKKLNAVDRAEWDLSKAIRDADVVIVAVPVLAMKETFINIAPHLKAGAVVTDVGSTKSDVLEWAKTELPRTVSFVGGHPMAGKTQSIEGAEATLFKGATWCVCPLPTAKEDAIRNVLGMIAALEAESYFIDAHEHDGHVAGVSHLPFMLSAALVNAVSKDPSWRDMKTLTSSGFRDASRLASGSATMHRDIAISNRDAVGRWIDEAIKQLQTAREALDRHETTGPDELLTFFNSARDARAEWATQTGREGELVQNTEMDLIKEGFGDQMGRMLLGGFSRKRRAIATAGKPDPAAERRDKAGTRR